MINGDRIKQAREICGFTQKKFARLIGVNQSSVAQMESGSISPTDRVLQRIVLRTEFPIAFFKQPNATDFPLGSLLFRARASMTLKQRNQARQFARVIFEVVQKLEPNFNKIQPRLPRSDNDPINAAIHTRSSMGLSPDTPITNLINTVEKNGVAVLSLPLKIKKQDAFSTWVGDGVQRPIIVISTVDVPGDRLRFNVAHELGHLVIHQATRGDIKRIEKEASLFASELLMPREAMLSEIIPPVTFTSLLPLKKKWKVSIQALIQRALYLKKITTNQYKYLMHQLSAAGYRLREPVEIPIEKPRMVSQMVEMLYGNPIDFKKLANNMDLPRRLIKETIEAHALRMPESKHSNAKRNGQILKFLKKS